MAGEVSEGMLFDIGFADGITPALAVPGAPGSERRAGRLIYLAATAGFGLAFALKRLQHLVREAGVHQHPVLLRRDADGRGELLQLRLLLCLQARHRHEAAHHVGQVLGGERVLGLARDRERYLRGRGRR